MARPLRVEYASAVYHVLGRGNNRQAIYLDDEDRRRFLRLVGEVVEQTGWVVHSYVLMTNHYHLLLETPEANLVAGMKWFQQTYTQRFNLRHQRSGHLYQGRYKALPVDEEEEGALVGVSGVLEERMAYEADRKHASAVAAEYKPLRRGWYVGSAAFRDRLLSLVGEKGTPMEGSQRRDHGEAEAERLLRSGLDQLGVPLSEVRGWTSVDVRKQALAWLLKSRTTVTVTWIAQRLRMGHRSNASRAISQFSQASGNKQRQLRKAMSQCTG